MNDFAVQLLGSDAGETIAGVVSFHGLLKTDATLNERVHARILVLHGQDDPMAPPADVGAFAETMKRIGAEWQLHAYPGVVHAFTNANANDRAAGMAYDAEADRRSWAEMVRFFGEVFA